MIYDEYESELDKFKFKSKKNLDLSQIQIPSYSTYSNPNVNP